MIFFSMSSKQILIILLSIILAVLLYLAPKTISSGIQDTSGNSNFNAAFEEAKKKVSPAQEEIFNRLEQRQNTAQKENNAESWFNTAKDFLKAARLIQNDTKSLLYKGAINGYEKTLELAPDNLSAKTELATAIIESSSLLGSPPMKGITLLREVIQKDSNNIEANLQLGLFSVTSQQYDKAINRFTKILHIDSSRVDMYIYIGDTYVSMGDKPKAIASYENYKARIKDSIITNDIDRYIKKLKQ